MTEKPNGCSAWVRKHELGPADEEHSFYFYQCDLPTRLHHICYFYEPCDVQRGHYSCRFNRRELAGQPCSCVASGAREEALADAQGEEGAADAAD
jgi:hypothetical protein